MKPLRRRPVRFRNEWIALLLSLLVIGGLTLRWTFDERNALLHGEEERLSTQARVAGESLGRQLQAIDAGLAMAADHVAGVPDELAGDARLNEGLRLLVGVQAGVNTMLALDASGRVMAASRPEMVGRELSAAADFRTARAANDPGRLFVSAPFRTPDGVWTMTLSKIVPKEDGGFGGVVTVSLDRDYFSTLFSSLRYAEDMWTGLAHGEGGIFLVVPDWPGSEIRNLLQPESLASRHLAGGQPATVLRGQAALMQTEMLVAQRTVDPPALRLDRPLLVAAGRPVERLFATWRWDAAIRGVIFGALALFGVGVLARSQRRRWQSCQRQRATEAALVESERRFRGLVEESLVGVDILQDGVFRYVNPRFAEMFGYDSPADIIDKVRLHDLVAPEDMTRVDGLVEDREAGRLGSSHYRCGALRRDGRRIELEVLGRGFLHEGRPAVIGMVLDITERVRQERELVEYQETLASKVLERTRALEMANGELMETYLALDHANIALHWVDADSGRLLDVNDCACRMLDYSRDELLALSIPDIDPTFDTESFAVRGAAMRRNERVRFETFNRTRTGAVFPVEVTTRYRPAKDGQPALFIAFVSDISERRRYEEMLCRAKEAAEAASRAKSAFIANMSHEIRTPLSAITGMVHLMRRTGVAGEEAARLDRIEQASAHLIDIVNSVLDLSKIESGKLELSAEIFSPAALLGEVADLFAVRAEETGLTLSVVAGEGVPAWVEGDPVRLRQSLINYVGNAFKFTPAGRITLRMAMLDETPAGALLRFEVEDTGIGIAAGDCERLFQEFEQVDNSTRRAYGGTGLGLAITRLLAGLMGGEAGVNSEPGRGSCFWFTARLAVVDHLPATAADHHTPALEDRLREHHAGARILVVDDEPINRDIACTLLEEVGLVVDLAADGEAAVRQVAASRYDLILMDMQMPRLDGMDATRAIRQLAGGAGIPVVAMTANVFSEDRARCMAAGMDDFVPKPIDPDHLFATLLRQLGRRPAG